MTDTIDHIRHQQHDLPSAPFGGEPPIHAPEMLLIGCVDARLNVASDIGIPYGKAIIHRSIAALVAGLEGSSPKYLSEGASVEFAVNVMKVKHIVVMGHTHCGGIQACVDGCEHPEAALMQRYLAPLDGVRAEVLARGGNQHEQARAMEKAAVRRSVENLMTYPFVREAVSNGQLQLHGWIIDTASKKIWRLEPGTTGEFVPL